MIFYELSHTKRGPYSIFEPIFEPMQSSYSLNWFCVSRFYRVYTRLAKGLIRLPVQAFTVCFCVWAPFYVCLVRP